MSDCDTGTAQVTKVVDEQIQVFREKARALLIRRGIGAQSDQAVSAPLVVTNGGPRRDRSSTGGPAGSGCVPRSPTWSIQILRVGVRHSDSLQPFCLLLEVTWTAVVAGKHVRQALARKVQSQQQDEKRLTCMNCVFETTGVMMDGLDSGPMSVLGLNRRAICNRAQHLACMLLTSRLSKQLSDVQPCANAPTVTSIITTAACADTCNGGFAPA